MREFSDEDIKRARHQGVLRRLFDWWRRISLRDRDCVLAVYLAKDGEHWAKASYDPKTGTYTVLEIGKDDGR